MRRLWMGDMFWRLLPVTALIAMVASAGFLTALQVQEDRLRAEANRFVWFPADASNWPDFEIRPLDELRYGERGPWFAPGLDVDDEPR